ncbi:MAG: LytTR family DNA-binding domain-containing protein [Gemmatimonadota bacterium]
MPDLTATPTALVVDDEPLARDAIRLAIEPMGVRVVAEAGDGPSAVEAIVAHQPDLVFLDVEMPGWSGFEVLHRVERQANPSVVFVTAYGEHAVEAFDAAATDYVVKPFSDARLQRAARRALARRTRQGPDPAYPPRFAIRTRRKIYFVATESIDFVEAAGNYVSLNTGDRSHLIRSPLTAFERRLDPGVFARVHRSAIVNLDRVAEVRPLASGDFTIVMQSGATVRMSRRFRERILR